MPDNNGIFSLRHEEHRRIFEELKAEQIEGRRASRKPCAIILLGQPGSVNDSLLSTVSQNFPARDFVMIDEEFLQQHHPKYGQAAPRANDGRRTEMGKIVASDGNKGANELTYQGCPM